SHGLVMSELRCFEDLDRFGAETANTLEDLAQDLYHRLIEPRGANLDDPDRGLGIEDRLSGVVDPELKKQIETEFKKDERVHAVSAQITELAAGEFRVEIAVQADEGELGLVLVSDAEGNVVRVA